MYQRCPSQKHQLKLQNFVIPFPNPSLTSNPPYRKNVDILRETQFNSQRSKTNPDSTSETAIFPSNRSNASNRSRGALKDQKTEAPRIPESPKSGPYSSNSDDRKTMPHVRQPNSYKQNKTCNVHGARTQAASNLIIV